MIKLKIAIQKNGRLHDESINILKSCGIIIENGKDQLRVEVSNFPLEILYLRNADIPQYLEDGIVDAAIIGKNMLFEKQIKAEIIESLGFSKCKVSLAIPKEVKDETLHYFEGKKIATSYPNILKSHLKKNKIHAEIHLITGSVEIAPNIGLADAICDVVSTGSTLSKNGLKETHVIFNSEAVLAKSRRLTEEKEQILAKLLFRMQTVLYAKNNKYILMNVPNDKIEVVCAMLPGLKSPTILPLAAKGWSSLHSVISEDAFWEIAADLKKTGAEDIFVIPIGKMVI